MYQSIQKLFKLPVFTVSGIKLGHVADVELDVETHTVRHYIVEQGFIDVDHYWVAPTQVRSITAEKIIVDDAILTDPALKESSAQKKRTSNPIFGDAN